MKKRLGKPVPDWSDRQKKQNREWLARTLGLSDEHLQLLTEAVQTPSDRIILMPDLGKDARSAFCERCGETFHGPDWQFQRAFNEATMHNNAAHGGQFEIVDYRIFLDL